MHEYEWKFPKLFNADPEVIYQEIQSIGEAVRPCDLVEYAEQNPDSELYKCFEWDDTVAAEKYRIEQARKVLQSIVIKTIEPEYQPMRALAIVTTDDGDKGYVSIRKIMTNEAQYEELLQEALAELEAFKHKYHILTELEAVFEAIDEL